MRRRNTCCPLQFSLGQAGRLCHTAACSLTRGSSPAQSSLSCREGESSRKNSCQGLCTPCTSPLSPRTSPHGQASSGGENWFHKMWQRASLDAEASNHDPLEGARPGLNGRGVIAVTTTSYREHSARIASDTFGVMGTGALLSALPVLHTCGPVRRRNTCCPLQFSLGQAGRLYHTAACSLTRGSSPAQSSLSCRKGKSSRKNSCQGLCTPCTSPLSPRTSPHGQASSGGESWFHKMWQREPSLDAEVSNHDPLEGARPGLNGQRVIAMTTTSYGEHSARIAPDTFGVMGTGAFLPAMNPSSLVHDTTHRIGLSSTARMALRLSHKGRLIPEASRVLPSEQERAAREMTALFWGRTEPCRFCAGHGDRSCARCDPGFG
jgi:hypothetical protein